MPNDLSFKVVKQGWPSHWKECNWFATLMTMDLDDFSLKLTLGIYYCHG